MALACLLASLGLAGTGAANADTAQAGSSPQPFKRPGHFVQELQVGLVPGEAVTRRLAWTPVRVELRSEDEGLQGLLDVWFESESRDRQIAEIDLPPGGRQLYTVYAKMPWGTEDPLIVRLLGPDRQMVEEYRLFQDTWYVLDEKERRQALTWSYVAPLEQTTALVLDGEEALRAGKYLRRTDDDSAQVPRSLQDVQAAVYAPDYHGRIDYDWTSSRIGYVGFESVPGLIHGAAGPLDENSLRQLARGGFPRGFLQREISISPFNFPAARDFWSVSEFYQSDPRGFSITTAQFSSNFAQHYFSLRFLKGSPGLLPTHAFGYDAIDLLIVDGEQPSRIDEDQQAALEQWVRSGGIVLLCGGARERWSGTWLERIAPALPMSTRMVRVPDPDRRKLTPMSILGGMNLLMTEAALHPEAEQVVSVEGMPVLARRYHGNGMVVFSAFSLRDAAATGRLETETMPDIELARQAPRLRDEFLSYILPAHRQQPRPWLHAVNALASLEELRRAARTQRVGADMIFLLGVAFFLVSVIGNAWLCRKLGRPLYFWPILGLLSLLGSLTIWAALRESGIGVVQVREATWLEADAGSPVARGHSFLAFNSGYSRRGELSFEGETAAPPFFFHQSASGQRPTDRFERRVQGRLRLSREQLRVHWPQGDVPQPRVQDLTVGAGSVETAVAEFLTQLGGTVSAAYFEEGPGSTNQMRRLRITNDTQYRLTELLLHQPLMGPITRLTDFAPVQPVPDLKPGETVTVDLRNSLSTREFIELIDSRSRIFDRLAPLRSLTSDRRSGPSLARLLLGMRPANLTYYSDAREQNRGLQEHFATWIMSSEIVMRYFPPTDRPDFAFYLIGRIEANPLRPKLNVPFELKEPQTYLRIRLPVRWLDRKREYSIERGSGPDAARPVEPVELQASGGVRP